MSTPTTDREEIARLIDPEAFREPREGDGPVGERRRAEGRESAYKAADRILAGVPNAFERKRLDHRFEEWWANAGGHVTPESPRKGLAYVAFCAGSRHVVPRPSDVSGTPSDQERWILADETDALVRELDVLINGEEGAARQASLCDIVAQVARHKRHLAARASGAPPIPTVGDLQRGASLNHPQAVRVRAFLSGVPAAGGDGTTKDDEVERHFVPPASGDSGTVGGDDNGDEAGRAANGISALPKLPTKGHAQ